MLVGYGNKIGSSNGTGTAARFNNPFGLAVDGAGTVYVGDSQNNLIRKITAGGTVSTPAGLQPGSPGSVNGIGSAARFFSPNGLAVDGSGTIYVADLGNNTIRKITSDGVVSTLAGRAGVAGSANGVGSAARFKSPRGIAVDGTGNVYVADSDNQTIRKITPAGVVTTFAGLAGVAGNVDGSGSAARFFGPADVAVNSAGFVYVADRGNSTIRKITSSGVVSTLAGAAAGFSNPQGVAVDSGGNVYVADTGNCTIRKIDDLGVVTTLAGAAGSCGSQDGTGAAARFSGPPKIAVDQAGNIFVADNCTVRKITSSAVVTTIAGVPATIGSADGTGDAAKFTGPGGIAVSQRGNVYVADTGNHTIRIGAPAAP